MFEGTYTPPLYQDLYNFHDGAQNDIFENTTDSGLQQYVHHKSTTTAALTPTPFKRTL
jgi:hypothetical protein